MSSTLYARTPTQEPGHRLSLEDQQARIGSSNHYIHLFHDTFPNNFSIVCLNKRYQKDILIENKKRSLDKLNRAAANLWVFTGMCLEKVKELEDFQTATDLLATLSGTNEEWGALLRAGNAFLTYEPAAEIINAIRRLNFPFDDLLGNPTYSVIKAAFTKLPFQDKAFVKICLFSKREEAYDALQRLIDIMHEHPLLFYYVERFEMATESFSTDSISIPTGEEYPAISIFLDSRIVTTHHHPLISEIIHLITPITRDLSPLIPDTDYAILAETNMTLCQGYRNYKRYLSLLGIIDEVYDHDLNYAFINNRI
jgi:hypothetical protein